MDAERWRRLEVLFDQALACPDAERGSFVADACAGDEDLHRELAAMLDSAPTAGSSLCRAVATEFRLLAIGAAATQVGRRIGRVRLVKLFGEGGMEAMYLAERDDAQFSQSTYSVWHGAPAPAAKADGWPARRGHATEELR